MSQAPDDDLLELIYATALDPGLWQTALNRVSDAVGGGASMFSTLDVRTADGTGFISTRSDPATVGTYAEYYRARNVFALVDDVDAYRRGWAPAVLTESDCLPWEDYQKSEFGNDFMKPQGMNASMFIRLELNDLRVCCISIGRVTHKGRFEAQHLEMAQRLQPHLIRAYRLGQGLSANFSVSPDLAQMLEESTQAMLLVDGQGRIRLANGPAERLLAQHKGLRVLGGKLSAEQAVSARSLERLIGAATTEEGARVGGAMQIPMPGFRYPLAVKVSPLGVDHLAALGRSRTALVTVTDLELSVRAPEEELRSLFGLSAAEARVAAAIFEGQSLREAADRFGVSLNTVRTQLARVHEKIGVSRQADLVKLMMRLAGG